MIDVLQDLCALLAGATTPESVARRLGTVTNDEAGLTAIRVKPSGSRFRDAIVVRRPDATLSHVDVVLNDPLVVGELVAAFGQPARPPRTPGGKAKLVFRSGTCVFVVDAPDDGRVTSISVSVETE